MDLKCLYFADGAILVVSTEIPDQIVIFTIVIFTISQSMNSIHICVLNFIYLIHFYDVYNYLLVFFCFLVFIYSTVSFIQVKKNVKPY